MDEDDQKPASGLTPEQEAEIFSGPSLFVNKTFITVSPLGVRLTFMEGLQGGAERFRTAVSMNVLDAMSLRDVLTAQLEKVKFSLEEVVLEKQAEPAPTAAADASSQQ